MIKQRVFVSFYVSVLKEEPDDLTHLAPTAGDACIPLEESTPFFSSCDVFDDLIDYCSLLPDDINSPLDSQCSNGQNKPNTDPFINYRDESSETSGSPHLLSPGGVSKVRFLYYIFFLHCSICPAPSTCILQK